MSGYRLEGLRCPDVGYLDRWGADRGRVGCFGLLVSSHQGLRLLHLQTWPCPTSSGKRPRCARHRSAGLCSRRHRDGTARPGHYSVREAGIIWPRGQRPPLRRPSQLKAESNGTDWPVNWETLTLGEGPNNLSAMSAFLLDICRTVIGSLLSASALTGGVYFWRNCAAKWKLKRLAARLDGNPSDAEARQQLRCFRSAFPSETN